MRTLTRFAGPLAPGRYIEPGFEPRLSFEIGRGGPWFARQSVPGFFDIQQDPDTLDVIAVQFCRPTAVYSAPDTAVAVARAIEAIAALRTNPGLSVSGAGPGRIAGLASLGIDIDTTSPRDSDPPIFAPVLRIPAGPISLASARRLRVSWVQLPDGPLAVLIGGAIAAWDRTLVAAGPIVASIRLDVS